MATLTRPNRSPRQRWRPSPADSRRLSAAEMVGPFMFAFGAFLLFWALNIFFLAADYIINQHAPFFLVLRFVIFRIPQAIPMAFPFGVSVRRAARDRPRDGRQRDHRDAHGRHAVWRIAAAPLVFGVAMLRSPTINEWVAPAVGRHFDPNLLPDIYHTDALPVEPQFFRKDPDTGNIYYVTQVAPDDKTMLDVQIFKPAKHGPWNETLQARRDR